MTARDEDAASPTRRGFIAATARLAAIAGSGLAAGAASSAVAAADDAATAANAAGAAAALPFHGAHQGGILTPAQTHSYFAAFDLTTAKREDVVKLLKSWTEAAAKLARGEPVAAAAPSGQTDNYGYGVDSGEAIGLPPSRLTITFGFGPGLFVKDGKDRYGLASRRPAALVDLPKFVGDQLVEARTGGDLSVQACADDPQVAFHAVRQLAALAYGTAELRWAQTGFMPGYGPGETPRNLMGFKDGTNNPNIADPQAMDKIVWVGEEGPDWMRGGSFMVVRRIRIALEHWDRMKLAFQEQTVGRYKSTGAPLGLHKEFDRVDLEIADKDGNPAVPENSHIRLASPLTNDGAQILRRGYSYNDGLSFTAERWPPWRQGMEYDAGLLFVCYQRDTRNGFIKIFENMAKFDMMNQFVTHTGGGHFACPRGAAEGEFIGQGLFENI